MKNTETDRQTVARALVSLEQLLDEERACLAGMRYEKLLQVVTAKRVLQSGVADSLRRLSAKSAQLDSAERTALRRLAQTVHEKASRNERLVRASLRVVDDLMRFVYRKTPAGGQYDRRGLSCRPTDGSTLSGSA